ncbi:hypothetical protein [Chenggangzhangella methanolivorans]|nr:hypothetical protein [Chenggangzhangella methanolivorans]
MKKFLKIAAAGVFALAATTSAAFAGATAQPGRPSVWPAARRSRKASTS